MIKLRGLATVLGTAAVTSLALVSPAHADAVVGVGGNYGGFTSYGDKIWVEHYEGASSSVEWTTNYGRTGTCTVTEPQVSKTCNYDMREGQRITLRICSVMDDWTRPCSVEVSDTI